ncbi:MAG: ROK family protein [Clostridiales bacterium]|nr:MAG: ROK family protein [Clostridiales bacterium]
MTKKGNILHKDSCPTRAMEDYKVIVADMADLIKKILNDTDTNTSEIKTIGIGCPGSIDDKKTALLYMRTTSIFTTHRSHRNLKKYYDVPVYVSNDANCAALGEFFALDDEKHYRYCCNNSRHGRRKRNYHKQKNIYRHKRYRR